jgi:hypothetical protein
MAITDINLSGKVRADDGSGVSGATVTILETSAALTGDAEGSAVTTNSAGTWSFTEQTLTETYDVKISSGGQVRYIPWSDEITLKTVDTSVLKVRGVASAAAPIYLFADRADDAGDGWRIQASASDTLAIGSDKAVAGTIIDYITITNGANAAASTVTLGGILDVNGSVDWDVTDVQVDSSGDIDLVSTANAAAAIYLQENGGTSGTIKIHADQGTSVTEGAESINILSDAGGVGIRSTANLAKAINITSDGGTTGSIAVFNDQGTSVTEGAESISLLSDAGGVGIRSTADLANAVNITVDGGTSSTMTLFNDQGTAATEGSASIQLLSDLGGINIKSGLNGANAILLTADAGTSETIVIHADQGTGTGSIELLSDAGGIEIDAGTDIILDAGGADIFLKDDGTLFGTLTNSSGELVIKSSSSGTTAATFSGANVTLAGTVGSGAITSSGIIKTDDTTEATSTTDGSLQTDGGLSVAKDAVFGDDVFLLSDSAVFNMGAGNDFTITHDGTTGATLAGNPITITASGASTWSTSSGALTITSAAALNLTPAGGSVILLDGAISIDAGVVTGATAITSQTIDATTDFTIGDTVITDGVITDSTGLALAANVTVTGNVLPNADDTYDLGSASAAWQDLFLEGDITLTDAGSITTSAGDLTLAAATGADVLLGDNETIMYVDGGNGFVGVGIAPAAQMQVKLATNVDFTLSENSGNLRINAVNDAVSATVGLEFNASLAGFLSDIDLNNNDLLNCGAAGNDWTTNALTLSGGTATQILTIESTGNGDATLHLKGAATHTGGLEIKFQEGDAGGSANNMYYALGYFGQLNYLRLHSRDIDGSSTDADIWRVLDGQTSIDANTTWDTNVFDTYDDVALLKASISPTAAAYDFGKGILKHGRDALIHVGVLKEYEDGWVGYNDQRMAALLAGGIYQNRSMMDEQYEEIDRRLKAIGG